MIAGAGTLGSASVSDAAPLPSAPRSPTAVPRNGQAQLTWKAPLRHGTKPITAYVVTPYTGGIAIHVIVFKSAATSHVVGGLKNGKAYSFRIAARTAAGTGPRSVATAVIIAGSPVAPSGVAAVSGDARANVSWKPPVQNNGAAITSYVVIGYVKWFPASKLTVATGTKSVTVTGLANGVTYRFTVVAKNANGAGPPSRQSNVVVPESAANGPPAAAGYFSTLPAGASLPSANTCAARVRRSSWEPRPGNDVANQTVPHLPLTMSSNFDYTAKWKADYFPRITGNFTGTTDEIIQWAACKWGISDNIVRAQAVKESDWDQANVGDFEDRSDGHCTYDDKRNPCPTSFGIVQVKWYFHPAIGSSSSPQSSYPLIKTSTAFNLDLELAQMRGCYDGLSSYLGNTRGNIWGCFGSWYSGSWDPTGGSYITGPDGVQKLLERKEWLDW